MKTKLIMPMLAMLMMTVVIAIVTACGTSNPNAAASGPVPVGIAISGTVSTPTGQIAYAKPTITEQIANLIMATANALAGTTPVGPGVTVSLFRIDNSGNPVGTALATAVTNASGSYTIILPSGVVPASNLIVCVGNPAATNPIRLRAIVYSAATINIYPASEVIVQMIADGRNNLANFTVTEVATITNLISVAAANAAGIDIATRVATIKAAAQLNPTISNTIIQANNSIPVTAGGAADTISGMVYGALPSGIMPTQAFTPLFGATVVANQNIGVITDANGNYILSGLGTSSTATISAAATGYVAQTIDGVPTGTVQSLHLTPIPLQFTTTITPGFVKIPVTLKVLDSAALPVSGAIVGTYDVRNVELPRNYTANTLGIATTLSNDQWGGYHAEYIYAASMASSAAEPRLLLSTQSYAGFLSGTMISASITLTPVNNAQSITINFANIPAGHTKEIHVLTELIVSVPGYGLSDKYIQVAYGSVAGNTVTIPTLGYGIGKYIVHVVTRGATGDSTETITQNISPGSVVNVSPLAPPAIKTVFPVTGLVPYITANQNFSWTAVPGALQYMLHIGTGIMVTNQPQPNAFYGWNAITSATTITKPTFAPANNGNFRPGDSYNATLTAFDWYVAGNGPAYAISPLSGFAQNPNMGANQSMLMWGYYYFATDYNSFRNPLLTNIANRPAMTTYRSSRSDIVLPSVK